MESHEIILHASFATREESTAPLIRTAPKRSLTMPLRSVDKPRKKPKHALYFVNMARGKERDDAANG